MKYLVVLICLISVSIAAVQLDQRQRYTTKTDVFPHFNNGFECKTLENNAKKLGFVKLEGHYYFFSKDAKIWHQAQYECKNKGAAYDMMSIENKKENRAIAKYIFQNHAHHVFWTGGINARMSDGIWTWAHNGAKVNYTNWGKEEPSNSRNINEGCMVIWDKNQGTWNNANCFNAYQYICEMQLPKECKQQYNSAGIISGTKTLIISITFILLHITKVL